VVFASLTRLIAVCEVRVLLAHYGDEEDVSALRRIFARLIS